MKFCYVEYFIVDFMLIYLVKEIIVLFEGFFEVFIGGRNRRVFMVVKSNEC